MLLMTLAWQQLVKWWRQRLSMKVAMLWRAMLFRLLPCICI